MYVINKSGFFSILIFVFLIGLSPIFGQNGTLTRVSVHGKSLENTVTKENPDREVSIYLPPSYRNETGKRYPVLYLLHGIADTDQTWTSGWKTADGSGKIPFSSIDAIMDEGIKRGKFGEMIIVMPNQRTNWFGSFYVNSSVTGNWEDFTVGELVKFVDNNYRTLSTADKRGIAGHSMGGYGALRIGMRHPDVFSVVYGLNPALMDWGGDLTIDNSSFAYVLNAKSAEELLKTGQLFNIGLITVAQAFSPNPDKPPFYCDFPFEKVDGKMVPSEPTFSKWASMTPVNMVRNHRPNLLKLRGLRFDSGNEDEFRFIPLNSRDLSAELTNNAVPHIFEEYNGDHRNRLMGKHGRLMTEVLPYFWDLLSEDAS